MLGFSRAPQPNLVEFAPPKQSHLREDKLNRIK
jgi:hypothetical protein